MKSFSDILAELESADHLQSITLTDAAGQPAGMIENKPGSQGSLKVYFHLWNKFGAIDAAAARAGLELYAEHTADARSNPGKHPNIDRLLQIVEHGGVLKLHCQTKG